MLVDANTLADPTRVRRGVLAERHQACLRAVAAAEAADPQDSKATTEAHKALDGVLADIQAEYAEDVAEAPKAPAK